jgi:penicillin-binding protein 1C
MKPFIYAFGMLKYALWWHNTILDQKMTIGDYQPQNADGKFWWLTTVAKALAWSRNIPALKMFQANGGESVMKPYLQELWFTTLDDDHSYGLSLAIGGGETTMLELSQAYSHLASTGDSIPLINPILEIKNHEGEILYSRWEEENTGMKKTLPNAVSWLIWDILSEQKNAPSWWYNMLSVKGLQHYAIKTWTSDKKVFNNQWKKEIRPKDGRLVMYSPQMIITIRAWNTDGSAMRDKAFGGTLNAPLLQDIVKMMSEQWYTNDQTLPRPDDQIYKWRYTSPWNDWRPSSIAE